MQYFQLTILGANNNYKRLVFLYQILSVWLDIQYVKFQVRLRATKGDESVAWKAIVTCCTHTETITPKALKRIIKSKLYLAWDGGRVMITDYKEVRWYEARMQALTDERCYWTQSIGAAPSVWRSIVPDLVACSD